MCVHMVQIGKGAAARLAELNHFAPSHVCARACMPQVAKGLEAFITASISEPSSSGGGSVAAAKDAANRVGRLEVQGAWTLLREVRGMLALPAAAPAPAAAGAVVAAEAKGAGGATVPCVPSLYKPSLLTCVSTPAPFFLFAWRGRPA